MGSELWKFTQKGFSELDNREIQLTVDDTHYLFRHFDPGVHPVTRSGDLPVPFSSAWCNRLLETRSVATQAHA